MATTPQPPTRPTTGQQPSAHPAPPTPHAGQPHEQSPQSSSQGHQPQGGTGSQPGSGQSPADVQSGQKGGGGGQEQSKREKALEAAQKLATQQAEQAHMLELQQAEKLETLRKLEDTDALDQARAEMEKTNANFNYINLAGVMPPQDQMAEGSPKHISDATKAEMEAGKTSTEAWTKRKQAEIDAGKKLVSDRAGGAGTPKSK